MVTDDPGTFLITRPAGALGQDHRRCRVRSVAGPIGGWDL